MSKPVKSFPVIDICSLHDGGGINDLIIAQPFAEYLLQHPNLHGAHRHTFYHLVLFTKGSGYHTIDFEKFPAKAGQMYFMIPGQVHSWNFTGETDGYIINFSEQLIRSFIADQRFMERLPFFSGTAQDGVLQLSDISGKEVIMIIQRIVSEVKSRSPYNKEMLGLLLTELLITVSRNTTARPHNALPHQSQLVLYNFRKLVDEYYAQKKLPKEYAELLYVTPNHLNALCKDLLGKPAGEVIRDRVLLEAKRLLVNGSVSIAEIAYQLGFSDNSYFTKFFRKYAATTPEEFRKTFTDNTTKQ